MSAREIVIVDGVRTPVGRAVKGSLVNVRPDDLSVLVIDELLSRTGIDPAIVEDVKWGCGFAEAEQGGNFARNVTLMTNLPYTTSAVTLNRYCSSSLEAINSCAQAMLADCGDVMIAGGAESMSMIPMGGIHGNRMMNPKFFAKYADKPAAFAMTQTAQYVAEAYGYKRADMDEYAKMSQDRTIAAIDAGRFADQILPVPIKDEAGNEIMFDTDECPRRNVSLEKMASLPPVSGPIMEGVTELFITAGNSCPTNDGAAGVLMMTREKADELGLKPFVKIVPRGMATAGVEPYEMGIGPVPATKKVLERTGLTIDDLDLIELNEAFAVQCLYFIKELGADIEKLNVNGGAIALGHPFGMSGARLMIMLMYEMRRCEAKRGLATLCVGGGMGVSTIVEREDDWK